MVDFVGPAYALKQRKADVQRSINLMPTPVESGSGKARVFLKPTPGLSVFSPADEPVVPPETCGDVILLLHADGTPGATAFTDSSSYARPATALRAAVLSSEQAKWGATSMKMNGSGVFKVPASTDFDFGTGDLTMEAWVYRTESAAIEYAIFDDSTYNGGPRSIWMGFTLNMVSARFGYSYSGAVLGEITVSGTFAESLLGRWAHIAATRDGDTYRIFCDGVLLDTATTFETLSLLPNAGPVSIGTAWSLFGNMGGFVDDARIVKGCARYTADFEVPTGPLEAV